MKFVPREGEGLYLYSVISAKSSTKSAGKSDEKYTRSYNVDTLQVGLLKARHLLEENR